MPWVRFDDQFDIHRKVDGLSDAAYRLHTKGIFWSARNTTDGHIRQRELRQVFARSRVDQLADQLVEAGAWHGLGHDCKDCPQPIDGWVIHDYLKYQPSRAQVERDRDAKTERQRRWREAKKGGGAGGDASTHASRDGPVDASRDAPVDPAQGDANPVPAPPRPEGSGAGDPPRAATARRGAAGDRGGGRAKDQTPPNGRLTGSPNFDAIERAAARGERRERLAAAARQAIPKTANDRRRDQTETTDPRTADDGADA
jgi:hypothetical protein